MHSNDDTSVTLLDRLGGEAGIEALVQSFYFNVFLDPRLERFFTATDTERLLGHQTQYLTQLFGSKADYRGKALSEAHSALVEQHGLNDHHFDAICENLALSLHDHGIRRDTVDEVLALVNATRGDVLGRTATN